MSMIGNFIKKLIKLNVLFGGSKIKLTGIVDQNNTLTDTDVIFVNASNTIQFPNQSTLPEWLKPGVYFRMYDGLSKSVLSSTDGNYESEIILVPVSSTNNGVLFRVLSVTGNTIVVDVATSTPTDRIVTGNMTLDARVAIVTNDASINRINSEGFTVYNIENRNTTGLDDGSCVASNYADHFHDNRKMLEGLITATFEINNIVQDDGYVGNVVDTVVIDNDGNVVYE